MGARDTPGRIAKGWNIREIGGAALVQSGERCTKCHRLDGMVPPIEPGGISKPAAWLEVHVADPEVIGPGVREAPQANQSEIHSVIAALARLRSGPAPAVDLETQKVYMVLSKFCFNCHMIDGVGGKEGPDLTHAGKNLDAATIEQRIIDPGVVDPMAEMPSFDGRIPPEDIKRISSWLAARK
jgi:mono/diheme cytochrome c family protein